MPEPTPAHASPWLDDPVFHGLLLTACVVLVYANALANGFAYDDLAIIVQNPTVTQGVQPLRTFLTPYWPGADGRALGLYRPLTILIFAAEWAFGGRAIVFHATSIGLHATAVLLLQKLLRRFVGSRPALAGALLFAVHPVHVEAVANVVGQSELVSACLLLGAAAVYTGRTRIQEVSAGRRRLVALLFVAALLAKESAIVLPALLFLLDVAQARVRRAGYVRAVARLAILLGACAAVYLVFRGLVLGGLTGDVAFALRFMEEPRTRILTALSVWPEYARLLFWPFHLSATYDPNTLVPTNTITPRVLAGAGLLLATLAMASKRRWWPGAGLGATWFLVSILPVSNLLFPVGTLLGERTLYIPSAALAFWAAFGLRGLARSGHASRPLRLAAATGVGVVTLAFGVRVVTRNPVWRDTDTVVETSFRTHPESFRAQWFHAQRMTQSGDSAASLPVWRRAFEIYPDNPRFLTAWARALLAMGRVETADSALRRARRLQPAGAEPLFVQGLLDLSLGRDSLVRERVRALEAIGYGGMADALSDSLARRR